VIWGAEPLQVPKPAMLRGSFVSAARHRNFPNGRGRLGLLVYAAMHAVLNRTRVGLFGPRRCRKSRMVERSASASAACFVGVFVAGCALAGIGGVMWAAYQEQVTAAMAPT